MILHRASIKVLGKEGKTLIICHPDGVCHMCEKGFYGYYDPENKRAFFEIVFGTEHQGPPGHAHGGYIALFLDEVMSFSTCEFFPTLLGKMEVLYKKPVPLNQKMHLESKIIRKAGRKIITEGILMNETDILARSRGLYIMI